MFKLVYAKSVLKDLKKIAHYNLPKIKDGIEELKKFPNVSQIKHLTNHPIASYRFHPLFLITHQGGMDVSRFPMPNISQRVEKAL